MILSKIRLHPFEKQKNFSLADDKTSMTEKEKNC